MFRLHMHPSLITNDDFQSIQLTLPEVMKIRKKTESMPDRVHQIVYRFNSKVHSRKTSTNIRIQNVEETHLFPLNDRLYILSKGVDSRCILFKYLSHRFTFKLHQCSIKSVIYTFTYVDDFECYSRSE